MKGWWSSLTTSLAGLRRLNQPYFLPLEAGAGSFVLLLGALVALVVGLSLLLADGGVGFQCCVLDEATSALDGAA